jgi:4'-phosphopantetheinyl transferase
MFSLELCITPDAVELDRTCPDCGRAHGRVRVAQADPTRRVEVSISHAGSWVLLAAMRRWPIGVDVERSDPGLDHLALASLALNAAETRALAADPDRAASFTRKWVRKEAVVKALGDGLRTPLADFEVSAPDAPPSVVAWPTRPGLAGRLCLLDLDDRADYRASLAVVDGRPARVVERDGASLLN